MNGIAPDVLGVEGEGVGGGWLGGGPQSMPRAEGYSSASQRLH